MYDILSHFFHCPAQDGGCAISELTHLEHNFATHTKHRVMCVLCQSLDPVYLENMSVTLSMEFPGTLDRW